MRGCWVLTCCESAVVRSWMRSCNGVLEVASRGRLRSNKSSAVSTATRRPCLAHPHPHIHHQARPGSASLGQSDAAFAIHPSNEDATQLVALATPGPDGCIDGYRVCNVGQPTRSGQCYSLHQAWWEMMWGGQRGSGAHPQFTTT